jgi:DNA polymerase III delta prime subunit
VKCVTLDLSTAATGILSAIDAENRCRVGCLRRGLRDRDAAHVGSLDSAAMEKQAHGEDDPTEILRRSVENDRVHSGYLFTGGGDAPADAAREFARALVCRDPRDGRACERCDGCQRSSEDPEAEPIVLDAKGKRGPTHRHIGDHPDLLWVERGPEDTRITIGQIRAVQGALRLGANEGGRRVAVVADAERMNASAQNALLRVLEEPPSSTTLVLVSSRASALLATIRSRSVRVRFPSEARTRLRGEGVGEAVEEIVRLLDGLSGQSIPSLLDIAEQYRGARATAAESVTGLIDVSSEWLRERVCSEVERGDVPAVRSLDAYRSLQLLRRELVQRNANPQMVAERLLLGLRDATA